jgi:hypothetical protein
MHHSSKTLVSESADQNKRFSNNNNIKNNKNNKLLLSF